MRQSRYGVRVAVVGLVVGLLTGVAAPAPAGAVPPTLTVTANRVGGNGIALAWTVSGGDSSNLLYVYSDNQSIGDPGFKAQHCGGSSTSCSTTVRVPTGGAYRFTVSVKNDAGEFTNRSVEVVVPALSPPTLPASQVLTSVDMFAVGPRTFSWSHSGAGYALITKPGALAPLATTFPATGSYTVPASELPLGRSAWSVQYCEGTGSERLCSDPSQAGFVVGPARFEGPERRFVAQGTALPLSWAGSGNAWFISDPQLGPGEWLSTPQWTFPASAAPGFHEVTLVSCSFSGSGARCSNRVDITAPVGGVVHFDVASGGSVTAGQRVGTVTPPGGSPVALTAPRGGSFLPLVAEGATVSTGTAVAAVVVDDVDRIEVVVGSATTATWTTRSWEADFTAVTASTRARSATGDPLDVAFDTRGGVWEAGEFGTGIAHLTGSNLTHVLAPLVRTGTTNPLTPTRPHRTGLSNGGLSTFSDLAEKVVTGANAVWFTHGGGLFQPGPGNHSRLVRVALDVADSPATPYDDRVCAIHVPGDNNQVIGATWDPTRGRLWFSAQNFPVDGGGPAAPALYWFADNGTAAALSNSGFPGCDNQLDYGNAAAVAAASTANLCSATVTTRCITRIPLPPAAAGLVGHVELDTNSTTTATDDTIWWVDYAGLVLGRYTIATGVARCFGLPPSDDTRSFFAGFPWQLRVSGNFVYLGEYGDNDLVRFEKTAGSPSTNCTSRPPPSPAMAQIHVPVSSGDNALHSIEVAGNRLWFTLANEAHVPLDRNASTFGYVDLASWAAGTPTGVLYDGLATLGQQSGYRRHSFRGIDVSPTGQVALADMHYDEVVRLTPAS